GIEEEQQENNEQRDRNDNPQTFHHALEIFILTAPNEVISRRQLDFFRDDVLRFFNITSHIAASHIDVNKAGGKSFFVLDHRWPGSQRNIGKLCNRNLSPIGSGNEHSIKVWYVAAEIP